MQNATLSSNAQSSFNSLSQSSKITQTVPSAQNINSVQYPKNSNEIRNRINGRGLRALREGQVISGGFRSLWEDGCN